MTGPAEGIISSINEEKKKTQQQKIYTSNKNRFTDLQALANKRLQKIKNKKKRHQQTKKGHPKQNVNKLIKLAHQTSPFSAHNSKQNRPKLETADHIYSISCSTQ